MDRKTPLPRFPAATAMTFNWQWAAQLVRALEQMTELLRNPGEGRFTTATYTELPSNDSGLEPGALFQLDGVVMVSRQRVAVPAGVSATGSVGSVTITT